jgi:hypothetical protein
MKRLNLKCEIVEAVDALLGGVIQDNPPVGTLIAGYMIRLSGTGAKAGALNVLSETGQLILSSAMAGNLVSEQNFHFIQERTRAARGSTRLINPGGIGVAIEIDFFHEFDISGDYSHGNVYIVGPGDSLQWVVPALAAADVQAGTVWEIHRLVADRGEALYVPRFQGRGIDLAEIRQTLNGRTASIQMQAATGVGAVNPTRVSLFDSQQQRLIFLPWLAALAYTNAMERYDQDEAAEFFYKLFSDNPDSIIKCFGCDRVYLETIGGVGICQLSHCVVDPVPTVAAAMASSVSSSQLRTEVGRVARSGIGASQVSALINQGASTSATLPATESAALPNLHPDTARVPAAPRKSALQI